MINKKALSELMQKLETERGPFTLFGLFMPDAIPGSWHLVLAAPWLETGSLSVLQDLIDLLTRDLGKEQKKLISAVIILEDNSPFLQTVLEEVGEVSSPIQRFGRDLFDSPMHKAYILKARPAQIAA